MAAIRYDVSGLEEAQIRIHTIPGDVQRQIRDLVNDAANEALNVMQNRVPRSGGNQRDEQRRSIAQSLDVETKFLPGGAGGGGFHTAIVGPIDDPPSHLLSVIRGSTEWPLKEGRPGNLGKRFGYPGNFFMHREGQDAQREWIDEAVLAANAEVELGIYTIRIDG